MAGHQPMRDPNTPSITEVNPPEPQTLNLNEIGQRYLAACQRGFDIAACLVAGVGAAAPEKYDELVKSVRCRPSEQFHRGFAEAKSETETYLLKAVISEALGLVVPFLEDIRTFCAVAEWRYGSPQEQSRLRSILTEERTAFLAKSMVSKIESLSKEFGVSTPLAGSIFALTKAGICLGARGGLVSEEDVTYEGELAFSLVSLDISGGENAEPAAKVSEIRRRFAVGEKVHLESADYLHIVSTVAMFITSTLHSVKRVLKDKFPSAA